MKTSEEKIKFHHLYPTFYFPERKRLKAFLLQLMEKEGKSVEAINYIFCNDDYLLQMNQQYLKHDTLTDIITFELSPKGHALLSDIYISIDRVKENAVIYKTSFLNELRRVILHGALHLAGYKDKSDEQVKEMRRKEEEYLQLFNVSRGAVSR